LFLRLFLTGKTLAQYGRVDGNIFGIVSFSLDVRTSLHIMLPDILCAIFARLGTILGDVLA
jgi:hypothetical protein